MTSAIRIAAIVMVASKFVGAQSSTNPPASLGSLLQPGMRLVYAADGVESPPWTIDTVTRNVALGAHSGCVSLQLRTSPTQAAPDIRLHCVDGSTMMNWDERTASARPARPLGARAALELPQTNRGRVRYETGEPAVERIPLERSSTVGATPTAIDVLPTTVTTLDSAGVVVRRLRERFSIALATATGGVFEVPDSTQSSGWRVVRRFELIAIRLP